MIFWLTMPIIVINFTLNMYMCRRPKYMHTDNYPPPATQVRRGKGTRFHIRASWFIVSLLHHPSSSDLSLLTCILLPASYRSGNGYLVLIPDNLNLSWHLQHPYYMWNSQIVHLWLDIGDQQNRPVVLRVKHPTSQFMLKKFYVLGRCSLRFTSGIARKKVRQWRME